MVEQERRYDRIAEGYARWWAPVLAPTARRLLDTVAPAVEAGARRIVDLGTGTGTLAIAAVRRWPQVSVDGVDASSGMRALAEAIADRELLPVERRRIRFTTAYADGLPLDDASVDLVVSSFVLQLVPSRAAVLREVRRVVRPGGHLAHVTWLRGGKPFRPDAVFDEILDEIGIGAREPDGWSGDLASADSAATALRRAGFRRVRATESVLEHPFDAESYAGFLAEFDEEDLFESLDRKTRRHLRERLVERLNRLPPADLVLRAPVVTVIGERPIDA